MHGSQLLIVVDGKTVFTLQKIIVGTPASQQSIAGECSFEAKKVGYGTSNSRLRSGVFMESILSSHSFLLASQERAKNGSMGCFSPHPSPAHPRRAAVSSSDSFVLPEPSHLEWRRSLRQSALGLACQMLAFLHLPKSLAVLVESVMLVQINIGIEDAHATECYFRSGDIGTYYDRFSGQLGVKDEYRPLFRCSGITTTVYTSSNGQ